MTTLAQIASIAQLPTLDTMKETISKLCFEHDGVLCDLYVRDYVVRPALGMEAETNGKYIDTLFESHEVAMEFVAKIPGVVKNIKQEYYSPAGYRHVTVLFVETRGGGLRVDVHHGLKRDGTVSHCGRFFTSDRCLLFDGRRVYADGPFTVHECVRHIRNKETYAYGSGSLVADLQENLECMYDGEDITIHKNLSLLPLPVVSQPKILLNSLLQLNKAETEKKILDIAFGHNLKLFGGYLRDKIVPEACGIPCREYTAIDLFTENRADFDAFVRTVEQKGATLNVGVPTHRNYFFESVASMKMPSTENDVLFNVYCFEEFYVDDFDVNLLVFDGEKVSVSSTTRMLDVHERMYIHTVINAIIEKTAQPLLGCQVHRLEHMKSKGWTIPKSFEEHCRKGYDLYGTRLSMIREKNGMQA